MCFHGFRVIAVHLSSTIDDCLRCINHLRIEWIAIGILTVSIILRGKRIAPSHIIPVIDVKRQRQNVWIIRIGCQILVGLRAGFAALAGIKLKHRCARTAVLCLCSATHWQASSERHPQCSTNTTQTGSALVGKPCICPIERGVEGHFGFILL